MAKQWTPVGGSGLEAGTMRLAMQNMNVSTQGETGTLNAANSIPVEKYSYADGESLSGDYGNSTKDSNAVAIKVNGNASISGSVSTQVRKLGLFIYVSGDCSLDGSIDMTSKGANHGQDGSNINPSPIMAVNPSLVNNTTNAVISSEGGEATKFNTEQDGNTGNAGINGCCGSGGGGSSGTQDGARSFSVAGAGSAGTIFSGGSGGGSGTGAGGSGTDQTAAGQEGESGNSRGGKGGDGQGRITFNFEGDGIAASGGGAGNPAGENNIDTNGSNASASDSPPDDGTGGLIVLIVDGELSGNGSATSNGSDGGSVYSDGYGEGGVCSGGGSGGGSINIWANTYTGSINMSADGGAAGDIDAGPTDYGKQLYTGGDGGIGTTRITEMNL